MHDPARPAPWTASDARAVPASYADLATAIAALLEGESDALANVANAAAAIYHTLPDVNWAGFYVLRGHELVLGPFQGLPACVRIPLGLGVCGTAAAERRALLVPDVAEFPGHIACDLGSRSELVVPLVDAGRVVGVLDLDSPHVGRFTPADQVGCERLAAVTAPHVARLAAASLAR
jgi:L-methionine (R)-S-oxide reductase